MKHGARIYNLFPLLAGPVADPAGGDWLSQLPRIRALNCDWVFINPFHQSGFSGSLYAIKDYYALDTRFRGASTEPAAALLKRFIAAARAEGLQVMVDLVINHTAKDALLTLDHPDWYRRDSDGSLYSPRAVDPDDPAKVTVWGDLAELDYANPATRAGLLAYWREYLDYLLDLGVRGFRCDAAYQVPAEVWTPLIAETKQQAADAVFAAETLGCTEEQVQALAGCGFDYLFNSAKWWDFHAPWLLRQYNQFRHIAPSIAFPESHDTARLAAEFAGADTALLERQYRLRYLFAAVFSGGVMLPVGFEYGFSKALHVVATTPSDWEAPRFDLSEFIAAVNAMKVACPALGAEGPQEQLPLLADPGICALLRRAQDPADGLVLTLLNPDSTRTMPVAAADLLPQLDTAVTLTEITPGSAGDALRPAAELALEPLTARVFYGRPA